MGLNDLPTASFVTALDEACSGGAVESSAVEPHELEGWVAEQGAVNAPGRGSAALQLQAFLDGVCGGWANSFG